MSSVFVHVGQCGNTLGQGFWTAVTDLAERRRDAAISAGTSSSFSTHSSAALASKTQKPPPLDNAGLPLLTGDGYARAVLVDSEPKVVTQLVTRVKRPNRRRRSGDSDRHGTARPPATTAVAATFTSAGGGGERGRNKIIRVPPTSLFRADNVMCEHVGRGNNWACGYNFMTDPQKARFSRWTKKANSGKATVVAHDGGHDIHAQHLFIEDEHDGDGGLVGQALHALRKEAERCDVFTGVVFTHSLSGGTGSGLGSRLLEETRARFPKRFLVSAVVSPFESGETPLQHYNMLLSMTALQKHADSILLFSNTDIADMFKRSKRTGDTSRRSAFSSSAAFSFSSINEYIVNGMMDVFFPTEAVDRDARLLRGASLSDFVASTCPLPGSKFVELWSARRDAFCTWSSLTSSMLRVVPRYSPASICAGMLAAKAIVRGDDGTFFAQPEFDANRSKLMQALKPVSWNPYPIDWHCSGMAPVHSVAVHGGGGSTSRRSGKRGSNMASNVDPLFGSSEKSLTLCMNRGRIVSNIDRLLGKAQAMYRARAYLHWYERYNCGDDVFEEAFEELQGVADNYVSLLAKS